MNHLSEEFFKKAGNFNEYEKSLLENELEIVSFKKGKFLLKEGEICSSIYFLLSGSLYHYKTDSDLNENILDLNIAFDWVLNQQSFSSREPSSYDIKVYEDAQLYKLSIESIHRLIAQSQAFLKLGKILYDKNLKTNLIDNNFTPDEKYQFIIKNKPALLQAFPQKMIASYLKITPETLSRVRNRFAKTA